MSIGSKRLFGAAAAGLLMSAALVAAPVGAAPTPRSYLILSSTEQLPAALVQKVQAAGGTLTSTVDKIGLAVATSSDPSFKANVSRIPGVRSVVPNVKRTWIDKESKARLVVREAYGNPPTSGDDDRRFDLQWGHDAINAPEAWNLGYRGQGALVAVLDDGIDSDHPDLAPNLVKGLSTSFVPGETFEYDSGSSGDPFSHGTHTSGTIVAADNGLGTIGVAPEASFFMVKVLSSKTGSGDDAGVIAGIVYAADKGADVINMSLGATVPRRGFVYDNGTPDDPTDDIKIGANEVAEYTVAYTRAAQYASRKGATIIASAGNDANDGDHDKDLLHLPSDMPHVISISATAPVGWAKDPQNTFLDNLASYSNYGQSAIDFAAPGGDFVYPGNEACTIAGLTRPCWVFDLVFSTGSAGAYYWSAGTSMAAPHASGVAALIVGKNGGSMSPKAVEAQLRASAEDLGKPGNDDAYGAGRVDALNAVR